MLQDALPALSEVCGLKPWHIDRLSTLELLEYLEYAERRLIEIRRAAQT